MNAWAVASRQGVLTRRYQRLMTAVVDPATDLEAGFAIYPSAPRRLESGRLLAQPSYEDLPRDEFFADRAPYAAARVTKQHRHSELWKRAIAVTLRPQLWFDVREAGEGHSIFDVQLPDDLQAFASYLYERPIIPFRESPLSGRALSALVSYPNGTGIGGMVGAYLGLDHGLLMLLTVPGGMIVGGAAFGLGSALEKGLHDKLLRLIEPPEELPGEDATRGKPE